MSDDRTVTAPAPIIRAAGEGERRSFYGGGAHTWKLTSEQTGGSFFLFEDELTLGKTTPLHRHPEADESLYILEGEILMCVDGEERRVGTGGVTFVPRGVPHAFLVVSETARLLSLQTPGTGDSFYLDASEPATPSTDGIFDIERLKASAAENAHAVELLGPPPFQPPSQPSGK